jgi:hypothetical protein
LTGQRTTQVAAAMVLERTGLVPHVNAGVMSQAEVRALRAVSGSQGLMLESTSPRLMEPGACAPRLCVLGWLRPTPKALFC